MLTHRGARKIVLGLLVDEDKIRLSKSFRKSLECHLYYANKNPLHHAEKRGFDSVLGLKNYINGLLSYTKYIDYDYYSNLIQKYVVPNWPV